MTPPHPHGLTLLELAATLAVLAALVAMAVPSMASALQRHRLVATAEHLVADVAESRHEAARTGQPLHLLPQPGADWCWAVATDPGCDCRATAATAPASAAAAAAAATAAEAATHAGCALRRSSTADHRGVQLVAATPARIDPQGTAVPVQLAVLSAGPDLALRVDLLAVGRARVCAPQAPVTGVQPC
jgi:type IV fimbrial biogenesis protein FimT